MKALLLILSLISVTALGVPSPYSVSAEVRTELENILSRLLPEESYFVQTSAKVGKRRVRKVVEGEEVVVAEEKTASADPPTPMPGFVPETIVVQDKPPKKSRMIFRTEEVEFLEELRVTVAFDKSLEGSSVTRAQTLVKDYVMSQYAEQARLNFMSIPLRKKDGKKVVDNSPLGFAKRYLPWILLGLLVLWMLMVNAASGGGRRRRGGGGGGGKKSLVPQWLPQPIPMPFGNAAESMGLGGGNKNKDDSEAEVLKATLMKHVFTQGDAFRLYYSRLNEDEKRGLDSVLDGPAYDTMMENLSVKRPDGPGGSPGDPEEIIHRHMEQFNSFVSARNWQEKRFFGFLRNLAPEQVLSLVNFEGDRVACILLRFTSAEQAAHVFDNLPADRRRRILSEMESAQNAPLTEMSQIEKNMREAVGRLPNTVSFQAGQEANFWGSVLQESDHQQEILADIEKTNPGVYAGVKKFKFSLEDAASLPDGILRDVLSEVDNEMLGLALASCAETVSEVLLESLSAKRRKVILAQLPSYRAVGAEQARTARRQLTRKIQEAMNS